MNFNPDLHHRKSIRLKGYDYTQSGAYFITLCAENRTCLFGRIKDNEMNINEFGYAVVDVWQWLPEQYPYVSIGEFIIMPNHFHGILTLNETRRGGSRTAHETPINPRRGGSRTALDIPIDPHGGGSRTAHETPINTHEGGSRTAPTEKRKSVGGLIGVFKTVSTKRINEKRLTPGEKIWQRNYYEHIIRDDSDYHRIADYILNNPTTWKDDKLWTE